ncbi:flagellar M-ring protein FliF [Salsuginibacillus halophilus]|uniref:Flagellar M-ring protein n=1 Tax=Salsuginibacillus halophilus TaxID=517424 RepID=A0A2P8HYB2_9BACI|nr:flagellar basal-body MS-ring/collar protein FliF [Salsuginibacillus halophilus]PSL51187.1 flagellar M-ring protein FliF [Salsuginibacillus halophilus]
MKETVIQYKDRIVEYWQGRSTFQKGVLIGTVLLLAVIIAATIYLSTRTQYEPLYANLSQQEAGEVVDMLNDRGISAEVGDGGSTVSVPEQHVDELKVDLAAEGIPQSGSIDYSVFEDQMGFGMTDNEFSVMERAAMQTELGNLLRNIDGINSADVMITLPEETMYVGEEAGEASASVVLETTTGYNPNEGQVEALYHLVSRSVPDLSVNNIVIMNHMFEHYDYGSSGVDSTADIYEQQRGIQQDIEQGIQREIQQMLGTMIGQDKVVASVTTDMDFTQESREEHLVEPVDEDAVEGIAVSVENIEETYETEGAGEGGIVGAGEDDIPAFNAPVGQGDSEYDRTEERVNYEVNRIYSEIQESPYRVRDLGLEVMVEPPDPEDEDTLPDEVLADIEDILDTIVRTSIDAEYLAELDDDDIEDRIGVGSMVFSGQPDFEEEAEAGIPAWAYGVGVALLAAVLVLSTMAIRRRRAGEEDEEQSITEYQPEDVPDIPEDDSEEAQRRKQLEKLAEDKPEEFSKLLRSWLSED